MNRREREKGENEKEIKGKMREKKGEQDEDGI